jgi:hypothetical protein
MNKIENQTLSSRIRNRIQNGFCQNSKVQGLMFDEKNREKNCSHCPINTKQNKNVSNAEKKRMTEASYTVTL